MTAPERLEDLVRSYLEDDEVALRPGDPTETRLNTWGYGFDPNALDRESVVEALLHVAAALRDRLAGADGPGTFYAWYDVQAGQLRCSLTSATADALPFGADIMTTTYAHSLVGLLAMDPHPGFIPWDELREGAESDESDRVCPLLVVWAVPVAG